MYIYRSMDHTYAGKHELFEVVHCLQNKTTLQRCKTVSITPGTAHTGNMVMRARL